MVRAVALLLLAVAEVAVARRVTMVELVTRQVARGVTMAAAVAAVLAAILAVLAVLAQFASSGQEILDPSLQLIQEMCNELLY